MKKDNLSWFAMLKIASRVSLIFLSINFETSMANLNLKNSIAYFSPKNIHNVSQ